MNSFETSIWDINIRSSLNSPYLSTKPLLWLDHAEVNVCCGALLCTGLRNQYCIESQNSLSKSLPGSHRSFCEPCHEHHATYPKPWEVDSWLISILLYFHCYNFLIILLYHFFWYYQSLPVAQLGFVKISTIYMHCGWSQQKFWSPHMLSVQGWFF